MSSKGKLILIVDDFAYIRVLFEKSLKEAGYEVEALGLGKEVLGRLLNKENKQPDLIVLDLNLPDVNGLDILKVMQKQQIDIPVIIVTAFASEELYAKIESLNVRKVLKKPVIVGELVRSVDIVFGFISQKDLGDNRKEILVVDDSEQIRKLFNKLLTTETTKVIEAGTGYEACAALKQYNPVLVILDHSLPGMDGLQTLQALRKIKPDIPAIVITAYPEVELIVSYQKLGISAFLKKPIDMKTLKEKVLNIIS